MQWNSRWARVGVAFAILGTMAVFGTQSHAEQTMPVAEADTNAPITSGDATPGEADSSSTTEERQQNRPGHPLRVAGWITFASSHGLTVLLGVIGIAGAGGLILEGQIAWPIFMPFLGPAVSGTLAMALWGGKEEMILGVFGWVSTLVQTAGLAMLIASSVQRRRARRENRAFAVVPVCGHTMVGLSATGVF